VSDPTRSKLRRIFDDEVIVRRADRLSREVDVRPEMLRRIAARSTSQYGVVDYDITRRHSEGVFTIRFILEHTRSLRACSTA
jgi:hypothetical protein